MDYIFRIIDKSGRDIYLPKERWLHITTKHTNMSDKLEYIKKALQNPTIIVPHKYEEIMRNYYLYNKSEREYLLVSGFC
jgi:hypothetical protein